MSLALLFHAHHVSDVNTSILRSLRLICWVISWVVLFWFDVCCCYVVVWLWWCDIRVQAEALVPQPAQQHTSNHNNTTHEITQQISRKLLRMDVLTSETCWALNNEITKQETSSWSLKLLSNVRHLLDFSFVAHLKTKFMHNSQNTTGNNRVISQAQNTAEIEPDVFLGHW